MVSSDLGKARRADTHLVLPGVVGEEPVETVTTGLHLCQICTAEPQEGQSSSYVSVATAVENRDEASLERTAEDDATLESDGSTALVEKGAELPAYQSRAEHSLGRTQTSSS